MTRFHVTATGHSLNYLPEYIARRHGFFEEQGLEVTVTVPKPWDLVLDELADGTADAAIGGIWVPSMYRGRGKHYTVFAQMSNRCPLALVKRRGGDTQGPFKVSGVSGSTILMKSGNGASVGLFTKMLLREHGVDLSMVHFVQDLEGPMLAELFIGGMGDYFVNDIVTARSMAQKYSDLSVVMEMATDGGDIPWSVYYRETDTITPEVLDAQKRFCFALAKGMEWVQSHDPAESEEFRTELAELFPSASISVLVDLTNLYRRSQMWTSPSVSRHGFERWQRGIADGRLVTEPLVYESIVDNGPAAAAAAMAALSSAEEGVSGGIAGVADVAPPNGLREKLKGIDTYRTVLDIVPVLN